MGKNVRELAEKGGDLQRVNIAVRLLLIEARQYGDVNTNRQPSVDV